MSRTGARCPVRPRVRGPPDQSRSGIRDFGNGTTDKRQQRSSATTARVLAMSKLTARRCASAGPVPRADATLAASLVILLYVLMIIVHRIGMRGS